MLLGVLKDAFWGLANRDDKGRLGIVPAEGGRVFNQDFNLIGACLARGPQDIGIGAVILQGDDAAGIRADVDLVKQVFPIACRGRKLEQHGFMGLYQ